MSPPWVTNLAIWEQYFSGETLSIRVAWALRPTRNPVTRTVTLSLPTLHK